MDTIVKVIMKSYIRDSGFSFHIAFVLGLAAWGLVFVTQFPGGEISLSQISQLQLSTFVTHIFMCSGMFFVTSSSSYLVFRNGF